MRKESGGEGRERAGAMWRGGVEACGRVDKGLYPSLLYCALSGLGGCGNLGGMVRFGEHYETSPTRQQWKEPGLMQKQLKAYFKSGKRIKPQMGIQLMLDLK